MEENTVKSNVVEIRPGTSAQTDREREFVELLLQKLREFREMGVEVDSLVMCFVGAKQLEEHVDDSWLAISHFISEDRNIMPTLAYTALCLQSYAMGGRDF